MFQIERQEQILQYVNQRKRVYNAELCEKFETSVVTIRNDLNELAKRNLLVKTFGGAIALEERLNMEIPSKTKYRKNVDAKRKIAKIASAMIEDNDVIILDSGSTTLEIAKNIMDRPLTVITNDIQIAILLAGNPRIQLILPGGKVLNTVCSIMGQDTTLFFQKVTVNKLFLGVDAIHFEVGISERTLEEVYLKQSMMKASKYVIACADSSKFGQQVFAKLCNVSELDCLITERMSRNDLLKYREAGIRVKIADHNGAEEL